MIRISVVYPNQPGSRFDADYYLRTHMPLAARLLGRAVKAVTAEIGVAGETPGAPPPYAAIAGFTCASIDAFSQAFLPVAGRLQSDIPNYTDIEPVFQISTLTEFSPAPPQQGNV